MLVIIIRIRCMHEDDMYKYIHACTCRALVSFKRTRISPFPNPKLQPSSTVRSLLVPPLRCISAVHSFLNIDLSRFPLLLHRFLRHGGSAPTTLRRPPRSDPPSEPRRTFYGCRNGPRFEVFVGGFFDSSLVTLLASELDHVEGGFFCGDLWCDLMASKVPQEKRILFLS